PDQGDLALTFDRPHRDRERRADVGRRRRIHLFLAEQSRARGEAARRNLGERTSVVLLRPADQSRSDVPAHRYAERAQRSGDQAERTDVRARGAQPVLGALTDKRRRETAVSVIIPTMSAIDPLGEFEHVVLLAILRLGDAAYAVSIRDEIEACTGRDVSRGSI